MAWPKGKLRGEKTGGRKAGTPNKSTLQFQQIIEEQSFNPGEAIIKLYFEQMSIYESLKKQKNYGGMSMALSNAARTLTVICDFVYPKKKAVAHQVEIGRTFADFMLAARSNRERITS